MIRAGLTKLSQGSTLPTITTPISSRRKRKHLEVEFEPEKQNKVEETKEINKLEKSLKKDIVSARSNKVSHNIVLILKSKIKFNFFY